MTLIVAAPTLFGADGPAPALQSGPDGAQVQIAAEQSPIAAARNNALALVRPAVDSLWEPVAWPMRHGEVVALAQRLQLTHEQTIAIERLHQAYFEQACAERSQAIESLLRLNPDAMRIPNVIAPPDEVKKAVNLRRGWMTTLSQLDETLFAHIAEVLGEAQAAKLPREQARRERARFATDAWVAQWFALDWSRYGYQLPPRPPLYEIADVVNDLDLDAGQRSAIDGMLGDCEAQLTRQVNAVFNTACKTREQLAANPHRLFSPEYHAELSGALAIASEAAMRLVLLEAASVDRMAKALPESAALIDRYLRAVASGSIDGIAPHEHHFAAALASKELTAAERQQIESLQSAARQAAVVALPAAVLRNRLHGMGMLRLGGGNQAVQDEHYAADLQAMLTDRKPADELQRLNRQSFEDIRAIVGDKRFPAINMEMNRPIEEGRRRQFEAEYAPPSNFVVPGAHFTASNALPRAPGAADVQIVLERLALDEGAAAIIRTLNDDRAAAWRATLRQAERDIQALLTPENDDDPAATRAAYAVHHRAIADFSANEAAFADSLRTALEGVSDDAVALLSLCRSWTFITSAPPRVPSPANSSSTSASVTLHLDRVNAVHVLLGPRSAAESAHSRRCVAARAHAGGANGFRFVPARGVGSDRGR